MLQSVGRGEKYDICIPIRNPANARLAIEDLARRASETTGETWYKALDPVTYSGDLYVQQIEQATRRYESTVRKIAENYKLNRKFTAAHAEQLLGARKELTKALQEFYPGASFFRIDTAAPVLRSAQETSALSSNIDRLSSVSPKRASYIANVSTKRALDAPTMLDEAPIIASKRWAERLKGANKVLVAVDILAPAAMALTARNEAEQKKALIETVGRASGFAAQEVTQKVVMTLCVVAGVSTGGLGFLACGLGAVVGGMYIGNAVAEQVKIRLSTAPD